MLVNKASEFFQVRTKLSKLTHALSLIVNFYIQAMRVVYVHFTDFWNLIFDVFIHESQVLI